MVCIDPRFAKVSHERDQQSRVPDGIDDFGLPDSGRPDFPVSEQDFPVSEEAKRSDQGGGSRAIVGGGRMVLELAPLPGHASGIGHGALDALSRTRPRAPR